MEKHIGNFRKEESLLDERGIPAMDYSFMNELEEMAIKIPLGRTFLNTLHFPERDQNHGYFQLFDGKTLAGCSVSYTKQEYEGLDDENNGMYEINVSVESLMGIPENLSELLQKYNFDDL